MSQAQPDTPPSAEPARDPEEKLGRLPPLALASYREFVGTGSEGALGVLVVEVLRYCLAKHPSPIGDVPWSDDTRLVEDLGLDSFGSVEIAFELEEKFDLKIPDAALYEAKTVKNIVDYIASQKVGK